MPPPELLAPVAFGPRRPSLTERHWPVRSSVAGLDSIVVALVAGLVAAVAIPFDRAGVGWLLTGSAAAAGLLVVCLKAHGASFAGAAAEPEPTLAGGPWRSARTREMGLWGLAVLALLGVGTVRAAGWLFVLCVLTAIGCAALSVIRGKTPAGLALAVAALPVAAIRALPWAGQRARRLRRSSPNSEATVRLAISAAIGVILLLVFGALFASADPAFGRVVKLVVPELDADTVFRSVLLFGLVGLGTLGAAFSLVNPTTLGEIAARPPTPLRRLEWAMPVGALVALFGAFVGVQVTVLFGDREYVMRTVGLTFAQYARRGFWQLLVVTLLTLAVIMVVARKAPRADRGDRALLRVLLGMLALGAIVVVASALWRMSVYEQAYGFTRLRVFVSAFELWLGVLFVLVLATGIRLRAGWLPRIVVATWVLTLLGLAVLNPDRFIAAQNVHRYEQTGQVDAWYLSTLSPDAAPELNRLPSQYRACALAGIARTLRDNPDDWRGFNTGRVTARQILADGGGTNVSCARRY